MDIILYGIIYNIRRVHNIIYARNNIILHPSVSFPLRSCPSDANSLKHIRTDTNLHGPAGHGSGVVDMPRET